MKIAFCLNSIQHQGGIAVSTLNKANTFAERGHEVYIMVTDYDTKKPVDLNKNVTIVNLDINYYEDDWKSLLHVLKGIFVKRINHKRKLKHLLKEVKPDFVISVGQSEKYFLPEIKGDWKTIREFHYDKYYRLRRAHNVLKKHVARFINLYDYNFKIKRYDCIVVQTEGDRKNWGDNYNVSVIPNICGIHIGQCNSQSKKILTVGRLEKEKNQASLIRALIPVFRANPEWKLEIYGSGSERNNLLKLIGSLNLENNVSLKGSRNNISEVYSEASIFVLTSQYEGFGLVLLEAMAHGMTVISYKSPCGPEFIISNYVDGLLINLNDEKSLTEAVFSVIDNTDLRYKLGAGAKKRSQDFTPEKIYPLWQNLFETLNAK